VSSGGFWCLFVALCTFAGGVIFSGVNEGKPDWQAFLSALNAWSTFAQAIAAAFVAAIAYTGLNAWKHQIKHEKEINVVWSTMAALQQVDMSFQRMTLEALIFGLRTEPSQPQINIIEFLNNQPLGGYLKALEEQCVWMDRVVTDNGWEWVNRSGFIYSRAITYLSLYRGAPPSSSAEFPEFMASKTTGITEALEQFKLEVSSMEMKLKELKQQLQS